MSQRLSNLAEYLQSGNYEMAVELHKRNDKPHLDSEAASIQMAKAYFSLEDYESSIAILERIKDSQEPRIFYEARIFLFKASYLGKLSTHNILAPLLNRLAQEGKKSLRLLHVNEIAEIVERKRKSATKQELQLEYSTFERLMKTEDDYSLVMEGMPVFVVATRWFEKWMQYVDQVKYANAEHPGPITQFEISDHPYHCLFDSNKQYTNRYLLTSANHRLLPKKCWQFLSEKYGGIEIARYNISTIDKPNEVIAETQLKKIEIVNSGKGSQEYNCVQISRKDTWSGVRDKLEHIWGKGEIWEVSKTGQKVMNDNEILEEVDTSASRYAFAVSKNGAKGGIKEQCANQSCAESKSLKYCQCRTVKYCDLDCLKEDRDRHRKRCQLEINCMKQQGVVFDQFNLQEKNFSGKKGIVGLRNLGNTCYMNSGLQCLSNTRELTEFFMKDEFKNHINSSNPLGTRGNLACAYAELIREIWTGREETVSPFKLKKIIGNFATQFAGFGQQDSQEFISYLIDGLQEDLNLVKKKETFQTSDQIKPDEEASRESELNYSKRIRSHIRNLMVGQFKSTVICQTCKKVSVCFDPYMLLSLPIPSLNESAINVVANDLSFNALKMHIEYRYNSTVADIKKSIATKCKEPFAEPLREQQLILCSLSPQTLEIQRQFKDSELGASLALSRIIFCYQKYSPSLEEDIFLADYVNSFDKVSYPRFIKFPKRCPEINRRKIIEQSLNRVGSESKYSSKQSVYRYEDYVESEKLKGVELLGFPVIVVKCRKGIDLMRVYEDRKSIRTSAEDSVELTLGDCLSAFRQEERLEMENEWYCGGCKKFRPASKQMEIYKSNKILVLAFKRFNKFRKMRGVVRFPVQGLDMGPYLLSNKARVPVQYDLYGVVNHYGSLGGGHYTAFCKNFLNQRWYEFNDSRVEQIRPKDIVSGDSYVLFYRRRSD